MFSQLPLKCRNGTVPKLCARASSLILSFLLSAPPQNAKVARGKTEADASEVRTRAAEAEVAEATAAKAKAFEAAKKAVRNDNPTARELRHVIGCPQKIREDEGKESSILLKQSITTDGKRYF